MMEWRDSDDHVLMTGPVAYEFDGTLPRELARMSEREFVTFGCRLNTYESEVMRGHAAKAGLDGRHRLQHLRGDGGSHAPGAPGDPQGAQGTAAIANIIVTGCAAQTDAAHVRRHAGSRSGSRQ